MGPGFTFATAVIALGLFGILTPKEIMAGFANVQIAIILLLLIIGDMIRKTSVVAIIFDRMFEKSRTYKGFMWRMGILVGGFSAFLNNTPIYTAGERKTIFLYPSCSFHCHMLPSLVGVQPLLGPPPT